ncbi:MAG: hypothetical protein JST19_00780 [Bacteroidetes bacterium]|nr:hypothetical protein [Bacteroidota bacterium]
MEEQELQNELASIRSIMERSSKFISLSGLSGILAGVYALIGAGLAFLIYENNSNLSNPSFFVALHNALYMLAELIIIAVVVLILSISTAVILSNRQAKKKGQSIWGTTSKALFFYMLIPLLTGGIISALFMYNGRPEYIIPSMLIFYGLSLVSASNFTFGEVKYLGLLEIVLGLIAACLPGYGLLFWALGFGVLHIIYGSLMYFKYDK